MRNSFNFWLIYIYVYFSFQSIRGRLSSIIQLSRNTGILIAYIVGAVVDYELIPCIFVLFPLLYIICFAFLPNTPQHYLLKNRIQVMQVHVSRQNKRTKIEFFHKILMIDRWLHALGGARLVEILQKLWR